MIIDLYEDNAGGLYLNPCDSDLVYRLFGPDYSRFADDAQSMIDGDEWQGVDVAPYSDIENMSPIASYDGAVTVYHQPGLNGQIYINGKRDDA